MPDPQGYFSYPGLEQIKSGTFALTHGTEPSVCAIVSLPQDRPIDKTGSLTLHYNGEGLSFPDCTVLNQTASVSTSGATTWTTTIADRRWRWRFGVISGRYNERDVLGDIKAKQAINVLGTNLDAAVGTSVASLIEILLTAMGEQGFQVSGAPKDIFPLVEWDHANPADELSQLLTEHHLVLQLGFDNRVRIHKRGKGAELPRLATAMNEGGNVQPGIRPSGMILLGGHTRFQSIFKLTAVGLDNDDKIKPLEELSYNPVSEGDPDALGDGETGFENVDPLNLFTITGTFDRDGKKVTNNSLAKKSVYRWYKIEALGEGGLQPVEGLLSDGYRSIGDISVSSIDQYEFEGGLLDHAIKTDAAGNETKQQKPMEVIGQWASKVNAKHNVDFGELYAGEFTIDQELRLIKFRDPVFNFVFDDSGTYVANTYEAANLYLKVAYKLKDQEGQYIRLVVDRDVSNPDVTTGPHVVRRPDIVQTVRQKYTGDDEEWATDGLEDNYSGKLAPEVTKALDAAEAKFETHRGGDVMFAGFAKVQPDGALLQVEWTFSDTAAPTTRVGRNMEFSPGVATEAERNRRSAFRRVAAENDDDKAVKAHEKETKNRTARS